MASLLALPTELLQRVASYLPCSAALNLIRVNRQVHAACNDRLVFRGIALQPPEYSGLEKGDADFSWHEGERYLDGASLEDTIRVAHAVERVHHHASRQPRAPPWLTHDASHNRVHPDVRDWLPHLLALHYPECKYFAPQHLLKLHLHLGKLVDHGHIWQQQLEKGFQPAGDLADFTNVGFCLAYLTLDSLAENSAGITLDRPFYMRFHLPMNDSLAYRESICWGTPILYGSFPQRLETYNLLKGSSSIVPFLYAIMGSGFFRAIALPIPSRMPFSSFMNIPTLYRTSAVAFSKCHIQKMTTAAFLSGAWMGYYSDRRHPIGNQYSYRVDPPMHTIELIAQQLEVSEDPASTDGIKTIIHPDSHGVDAHGPFQLHGSVSEHGDVKITKTYVSQDWPWLWKGAVTPFGIVGAWGSVGEQLGGYFWIWKVDWC